MCTALVVGNMVGSGVFLLPASLASFGGVSILGWLVSAAGALLLALVFADLSRMVPRAGGPYAYTREGFGEFAGFLVAWGYWISILVTNAAIAVAFVSYLTVFWPALATDNVLAAAVALAAIWLLSGINALGVYHGGVVQVATTVLKLVPLVALASIGLLHFDPAVFPPFNPSDQPLFSATTATITLTLWAFLGLESATVPAGDVDAPERTIPRATVTGTLLTAGIYVLSTVAVMGIVPAASLAASTAPYADAATTVWGGWAGYAVAIGAVVSCFGALNGWILLQGQIPLAAARDGLFPAPFARVTRKGAPAFGIVISSILVTVLMAMNYTRGLVEMFTFVILLATLACLVPYVFSTMAELLILIATGRGVAGRKLASSAIVALLAFVYSMFAIGGAGESAVFWGFLLLLAGLPVYVWLKWSK